MAPRRPTKRTKVTDTRSSISNNGDKSPVVVASSPGVVESTAVVATTTTVDIKGILLSLYDTKTKAEAIKIMESLEMPLIESKDNCQELFDLQGISTILSVIRRFKTSTKLVGETLCNLLRVICHLKEAASNLLIRLDFHKTLLSLANMHTDAIYVQTRAAMLFELLVIYSNPQFKVKLGSEEIIQFMSNWMTTFPDIVDIVHSACSYFDDMSNIPELKDLLLENEVGQPLMAAFQKFRKLKDDDEDTNDAENIVDYSKKALGRLVA